MVHSCTLWLYQEPRPIVVSWYRLWWNTETPGTTKARTVPTSRLLLAGCKSNTGDVEQSQGRGWEPSHTEHRLTLCLCHHPGSCTHGVCSCLISGVVIPNRAPTVG